MKIAVLGATGRTGRHVVALALEAGHHVRVLCRREGAIEPHPALTVIIGELQSPAFAKTVEGCDAVISALGPGPDARLVCSTAAEQALASGVKRYISVSGAGLDAPGDQKRFMARLISWIIKRVTPEVMADKVRELELLSASTIDWTLVRPPRLVDSKVEKPVRTSLDEAAGTALGRRELARFCLDQVTSSAHLRRAPFVSW
jgi:putative NADH-flavin reductase